MGISNPRIVRLTAATVEVAPGAGTESSIQPLRGRFTLPLDKTTSISAVEKPVDRFLERRRVGQRGVFELLRRAPGLAYQEGRSAREAFIARCLCVADHLFAQCWVVAVAGPLRQIQARHLSCQI